MDILLKKSSEKAFLIGNEAIVRGALESGVDFVSTYPGTPASEIGNIFNKIQSSKSKIQNLYFEFSTNEKVALEAGIGASFSGLKTLVAMKNFGLNVALDSLAPFVYTGSKGPCVIVVADDPNCHSSAQSEENSRGIAFSSHIPVLEPADPQECLDFVKLAFEISEKFQIPVMVRTTTRVAHQSAIVKTGQLNITRTVLAKFIRDQKKFVTMPPRVLEMKKELLEKIERVREFSEKAKINAATRDTKYKIRNTKTGIITSGVSYLYIMEALKELNLNLPVLKLGFFHPLPEKKIQNFIKNLKQVLIVEELEPYLEKKVERLAKSVNPKLKILGKNLLPEVGELKPELVASAIAKVAGINYKLQTTSYKLPVKHLPRFCPGCPYHTVFAAIKKALQPGSGQAGQGVVFGGDIGCYMLGSVAPVSLYDYLLSMGSSIGIGHGVSKATKQKVISFIGDSTFFHAGIPALINAVFNKSNPIIIILDNGTTAMTGHQPHPGTSVRNDSEYKFEWPARRSFSEGGEGSLETSPIRIEEVVKACGVKNLKIVDSFSAPQMEEAIKEFLPKEEVSVIIARGICALLAKSLKQ